jgi:hypothetical protein
LEKIEWGREKNSWFNLVFFNQFRGILS